MLTLDADPAGGYEAERLRVEAMLGLKDPRGEAVRRIALKHGDGGLRHDGPQSISGRTKCTVQPVICTPSSRMRAWVCKPLNAGNSDGWMLR